MSKKSKEIQTQKLQVVTQNDRTDVTFFIFIISVLVLFQIYCLQSELLKHHRDQRQKSNDYGLNLDNNAQSWVHLCQEWCNQEF